MENEFLIFISGLAIVLGFFGVILPLIPGVWLSLVGLLIFKYSVAATFGWNTLIITLVLVIISQMLSYLIPIAATKKFGGSKYGIWGAIIGLFLGVIFGGPFGIVIGPFLGVFVAELINNSEDIDKAFKAALGTFVGFSIAMGIELMLCFWILYVFLKDLYHFLT